MSLPFGVALRMARGKARLTQNELADKAGFHHTALSRWEKGRGNPSLGNIKTLLGALNMTFEEVFCTERCPTCGQKVSESDEEKEI